MTKISEAERVTAQRICIVVLNDVHQVTIIRCVFANI